MIDMASVYAERFKQNPRMLQAAVMGQSPDPKLDPYTALNALRLIKESNAMAMAGKAQQPTSAPSILAETMAPPAPSQGLAGMMPMGAPAGQMPQQHPMPQGQPMPQPQQAPVQQASGGLAGMPVHEQDYAGGGIVAFAKGGNSTDAAAENDYQQETDDEGYTDSFGRPLFADDGAGNPRLQNEAYKNYEESRAAIAAMKDEDYSPEEARKYRQDYYDFLQKNAGADIYSPALEKLKARDEARGKDRNHGEAMALLTAAGKILKGHNLAMGASEALPAYAQQMGEAQRADAQEQRAIEQMNFALADAQRKERMGDARGAQAAMETARKAKADANRFNLTKATAIGNLDAKAMQSLRATGKGAGAGGPKVPEQLAQAEYDELKTTTKPKAGESPEAFDARIRAKALRATQDRLAQKQTFSLSDNPAEGPKAQALKKQADTDVGNLEAKIQTDAATEVNKSIWQDGEYRAAQQAEQQAKANGVPYTGKTSREVKDDRINAVVRRRKAANASGSSSRSTNPNVINLD
jgi:hypothetical protein